VSSNWKAGVIGCGSIAQALHLPGYLRAPGVTLVAACDPVPQRLREAQRISGNGLRTYDDYRGMLEAEQLDVVSVATPNAFHAEQACAALNAGAHVLLEKPAALTMKEIDALRRTVSTSGRQLVVGFSHRFHRGNQRIRRLLRAGAIGDPYMIRLRLAHTGPFPGWAKDDWFYDPKLAGGGAMLDLGIHMIDQALWLMGPIKSVQATAETLRKDIHVEDNAVLLLEFARSRALGYIEVSWTSPAGFMGIEIMGDKGCIVQDYAGDLRLTTCNVKPNLRARRRMHTRVVDPNPTAGGWATEITDVVRALRRNDDLEAGIEAGAASLAVALAAFESSRTGRRVTLNGNAAPAQLTPPKRRPLAHAGRAFGPAVSASVS
jgi:UDP-N-acetylglucosamine 3-dehydrogenase